MKRLCYTLSSLALAAASPAMAETVATELWAEWQAQAEAAGQTVTAEVTETDNGLTLSNFTTVYEDEAVSTRGTIDEIVLVENSDGTVSVTYSDLYTMTFTFEIDPGDPPANIEVLLRHENLEMTISGDAGARSYAYTADRITVTEGELWGGDGPPPTIELDMVMTDIATTYNVMGTDPATQRFTSEGSVGGLTMVMEILPPPPEEGEFKAGLVIGPMQATSEGTLLSLTNMNQLEGTLPEGFELSGSTAYASMGLEMQFEAPGEGFAAIYSNEGGAIGASISSEAISYDIAASGARATITGTEIPVPVEISVGSSELVLSVPMAASDTPQDMGMRLGIQDLMVGESVLGMIDPGQALPRDPASLLFDATGQVQLFVDLMGLDPETMTGPPGELRAITVNELNLSVGGAELSGTADFSFAPNQLIPMPVGSADLQLSGGNALMEALVAGGVVPPAQSGMVMGMANVFARPGATPDTLETTVEFGADGTITANGVPLQ
ncbi:hypothetical protein KUL25_17045 [Rhodobacteraceae bacterium N5(2021)]|uniref:DUF2125 domain-containing protein n=1 Tax=Gymnodinialimonas phycosphaerae TaxID=2841589 RepID=A0A975TT21_9RHOB|nr:DUF2125 domain-containing protein [Gymnodinialimonas phycosphaerae]MBY4894466.1 hypothetical protein [Gymnodinialimonas phycosphaerae]